MTDKKTGVLLINLGTPDKPTTGSVRTYLTEFLNDPRVIDLPWLARKLLVNLIIVPFRAGKSAKIYQELWTEKGSPLLLYTKELQEKLQPKLPENYTVHMAMRYQNPSMDMVMEEMRQIGYERIIVMPLFPQYASASNGSAIEKAMKIISKWWIIPELRITGQFYDHPKFIEAFVARGKEFDLDAYDHIMFSYHGLPERHVDKVYTDGKPCEDHNCEDTLDETNHHCYKATAYATTRAIASGLGLAKEKYTVAFQSRLDNKWLKPFSDKIIEDLAKQGKKNVLVFSPAFVADCLETTVEIGIEYQEIFEANGGEKIQLAPSLNADDNWIDCVKSIVLND